MLLTALVLCDLVATMNGWRQQDEPRMQFMKEEEAAGDEHVLGEACEMLLLVAELLLEFEQLLLLALADGIVLTGTLASLKSVAARAESRGRERSAGVEVCGAWQAQGRRGRGERERGELGD